MAEERPQCGQAGGSGRQPPGRVSSGSEPLRPSSISLQTPDLGAEGFPAETKLFNVLIDKKGLRLGRYFNSLW